MMKYIIQLIALAVSLMALVIALSGCAPHGMANLAETAVNYSIDFSLIQDFEDYLETQCPLEGYQVIIENGTEYCVPFDYDGTQ